MEKNTLLERIQNCCLFSDIEKEYWAEHLDELNQEEQSELQETIEQANQINWTPELQEVLAELKDTDFISPTSPL